MTRSFAELWADGDENAPAAATPKPRRPRPPPPAPTGDTPYKRLATLKGVNNPLMERDTNYLYGADKMFDYEEVAAAYPLEKITPRPCWNNAALMEASKNVFMLSAKFFMCRET